MKVEHNKWIMLGVLLFTDPLHAYWSETHQKFAQDAYDGNDALSSVEGSESMENYYTNRLGFPLDKEYIFYNLDKVDDQGFIAVPNWATMKGEEIFIQGADDEDLPTFRATNHFFDPAHNQSLRESIDARYPLSQFWSQYDDGLAAFTAASEDAIKTPDWALEDNGEAPDETIVLNYMTGEYITTKRQNHSLHDSYDYLYTALTATYTTTRNKAMGKHIYALGHVIHLLTDMGQPEHVRNDVHLASIYEHLTEKLIINSKDFSFLPNFFDNGVIKYGVKRGSFTKARDYFHTTDNGTGIGLAEFTNRNFVSPTTNFDTQWYMLPAALDESPANRKDIAELYGSPDRVPKDGLGNRLSGKVQFVSSILDDRQTSSNQINYATSSHSIFNSEVNKYHSECNIDTTNSHALPGLLIIDQGCKRYTLNRWNYDSYRAHLAPRIIGYGAAFLKHLARGTMEMRRPDSSFLEELQIDPITGDIAQLPVAIRNTTSTGEAMGNGKLTAVITYVDSNDEVVEAFSSKEVPVTSLQKSDFKNHVFKFVKKNSDGSVYLDNNGNAVPDVFPLSKPNTTAYIQVVYRGKLGDEADIIVVARKPLSEIINLDALPNSGVYALVEHRLGSPGFGKMKLKLSSDKPLDGTIRPIAIHHLNNCYKDDLTGEYNVEGQTRICIGADYRSDETYYKAAFELNGSNITAEPQEFDVNFQLPIPFNSTDLQLALYHYPADTDAPVGVSFVDISEPTFISFINSTDYTSFESEYKSYQELEEILTTESDLIPRIKPAETEVEIIFGTSNIVSAKIERLPIAQYSRIAILTEEKEFSLTYNVKRLDVTNTNPTSNQAWYPATVNQDVTLADGSKAHQYPSFTKLRNVISNINILLEYKPILPLPDTADTSTLPDAVPSNGAVVIY